MPNWIEGSLKIRGPFDNIWRFFEEGLEPARGYGDEIPPKDEWIEIEEFGDVLEISIMKDAWVKDSRRAFLDPQDITLCSGDLGKGYVCMSVRQAWGFREDDWVDISKKFGVEIRLYGIECGMGFDETLEIKNGKLVLHDETEYDDWNDFFWRCPFPNMGG